MARCRSNHLQLNISKTNKMWVDFWRSRSCLQSTFIEGINVVRTYKYLGLQLDDKLDWTANPDTPYRNGQSRRYFLRRLGSFTICTPKLLMMSSQSVVASILFYAVVCWRGNSKKRDTTWLNRLVKKALVLWWEQIWSLSHQ